MQSLGRYIPHSLAGKASQLNLLNQAILDCLPTELIGHVQVGGLNRSALTLIAASPAWASKLRYSADEIGRLLAQKIHKPIHSVSIKIQPASVRLPAKKAKRLSISSESACQIKALADSIDDPSLKKTLTNLSRRGKTQK